MRHLAVVMFVLVGACGGGATELVGGRSNRVPFAQVFQLDKGRIAPKRPVQVGSVTMSPGVSMACGMVKVEGVDLCTLAGHDLEVEEQGDKLVVKGVYK